MCRDLDQSKGACICGLGMRLLDGQATIKEGDGV